MKRTLHSRDSLMKNWRLSLNNAGVSRLSLSNAGVSLIELIVAILILAIIATPLLRMFTSAARVNAVNTSNVNADTVAQNVMEAVKVYGIINTSDEIYNVQHGSKDKCFGIPVNKANTKAVSSTGSNGGVTATITGDRTDTGEYIMNQSSYTYHIDGIAEGTGIYDVDIRFDAVSKYAEQNQVPQYSLSFFDESGTLIIDPMNDKDNDYLDAQAIYQFAQDCKAYCDSYNMYVDQENSVHFHGGSYDAGYPLYKKNEHTSLEQFATNLISGGLIDRVLKFEYNMETVEGTGKEMYHMRAVFSYKLTPDSSHNYIDSEKTFNYPCCDVYSEEPIINIYVIYTPFPYMCKKAFNSGLAETDYLYDPGVLLKNAEEIPFDHESVVFENNTVEYPEVFISVQYDADKVESRLRKLKNEVTGTHWANVSFYCQAELTTHGNAYAGEGVNNKTIIKTLDPEHIHKNRIVNVTITVTSKDGDVSRTMTSTIGQQ
ncbi:MAG: prepilin-type N-terminal cleavage/methylation domain-containing protein [Lachnospiraceae bacterium]|nr:prepilin-type N-terminal cleavage/methylation domain-containing protein [Lachnospiraceae bacterium]